MKCIVYIILAALFSACHTSGDHAGFKEQNLKISDLFELKTNFDSITTIKVTPDRYNKLPEETYNLIDTIFSVKLETNRQSRIGYIDEIKIYKDRIYVLDKRVAKMIFAYEINGRFIGTIGKNGRGPGEYEAPEGLEIDKVNNELIVVSVGNRKYLRYDLVGNFLGDFNVEVAFADFKILDDGSFVLLAGDEPNIHLGEEVGRRKVYVTDNRGTIVAYGPKLSNAFKDINITRGGNLLVQNNEISYSYKLSDTIFQVNNNEISAKYKIDLGPYTLNREALKGKNTQDYNIATENTGNHLLYNGAHFQTKDYLLFQTTSNGEVLSFYYNKNKEKLFTSLCHPNQYDYWTGNYVSSYKDYFIATLNAHTIREIIEITKENNPSQLMNMYANMGWNKEIEIKDSDNPVLFFYKLK